MWPRINWFAINRLSIHDRLDVNWLNVDWFRVNRLNVNWRRIETTTSMSAEVTALETSVRGSFQPRVSIRLLASSYRHLLVVKYFCFSWNRKGSEFEL
jgi:hypothetical protein